MSVCRCFLTSLLALVCAFAPAQASAKPKYATFKEVVEASDTIAVAKFAEKKSDVMKKTVELEFFEVLKGDLKPGKHRISIEDQPWFEYKGEVFLVFLDAKKIWRFAAHSMNGKKLDEDLLLIAGFYDTNAYFVDPGLVTLKQLQKYLKDKTLNYRFRGAIYFPEAKKVDWKAGSLMIKGTYDAGAEVAHVEGLPELKGIAAQPKISMNHWRGAEFPSLDLRYSDFLGRALTVMGKVDGIDLKTEEILVRFAVEAPEVLTQKAFEEYLANPKSSGPYYKFKLACKRTTEEAFPEVLYFFKLKSTKRYHQDTLLVGYGKTDLTLAGSSYKDNALCIDMKTETGAVLTLEFNIDLPEVNNKVFHWTFQSLLPYSIYRTTTATGTIKIDGQTVATFTASLDSVGMNQKP